MKNCLSIFILALMILPLLACNRTPDGKISMQPHSLDLNPPPGPPEYQQGWSDGCESAANAYSNNFYQMTGQFEYRFNAKLRNNKMYYQVWKDAFLYCSIYWERQNQPTI